VRKSPDDKGRSIFWLLSIFALFLLFTSHAVAQTATVVGTVTDPSGAVVANATVKLTSLDTGLSTTVVSAGDGQFVVPDLAIGHYSITSTAAGFKSSLKTGITLSVGDRVRIDFQLQVGTAQQTVTVEADELHLQTDTGEVSDVISSRQVEQLETNGRSIYTLITLTPGASGLQGDDQAPTSVSGNANVSFNGARMAHNIYLMDGGEDDDRGGSGTFSVVPSLEAIAEFQILTSNYSPEYGLSSAATMSTVIKSGTKSFHGSGWEIDRNDALDAVNYFQTKKPELRSNIFGFNIGGPVSFKAAEPRTFFFYNQEWRRVIQGGSLNQLVPLPSEYGGNFAGSGETPAVPCASTPTFTNGLSPAEVTAFQNAGITTFSTLNDSGSCSYNETFLAATGSNAIPTALLDPNAQALLTTGKIFPANTTGSTASTAYFKGGANSPTFVTEEIARVDHKFGDKFSVFGHWVSEQVSQDYGTTMWSGDNVPTIGNTFGNPSYSAVIHTTYTINPNVLNEAAFNYDGNRIHILPKANFGASLTLPSGFTANRIFSGPNTLIPTIDLANTGTQYTANWTPWNNDANDYQIRDDVSLVKGAHQFKFGASWALYTKAQSYFAAPQGDFTFNGNFTSYDFADMLLGFASANGGNGYQEAAVHASGQWDNKSYAIYAADNWHASSRLTLNLGLRWDGVPHTYEANHGSSDFYPYFYFPGNAATFDTAGNICSGSSDPGCSAASPGLGGSTNPILAGYQFYLNGVGIDGEGDIPKGLVKTPWNAFGPRVGYSYDLTGHGKTVVRGGFGIMYERIQGNDMYDGATNVPFDDNANFNNVSLSNPHVSVSTGNTLTVPIVASSITGIDSLNYKLPDSYQYSSGVQQQLAANTILSVSYVGTQSRHQNDYRENNLPAPGYLQALGSGTETTPYNELVPYAGFVSIKQAENVANGEYNSLQVDLHTVIHRDLQAQFGYTLAKAWDPSTGGGNGFDLDTTDNPYEGWKYDWGPSIFDRRQVAFLNYIYDVPIFRNSSNAFAKSVLGGWEIAGISTFESGAPLNFTLGGNDANIASNGVQNATNYPNLVTKISYPKTRGTNAVQWFNNGNGNGTTQNSVFVAPAPGSWGTIGHNSITGPGRDEWNIALHKVFKFSEHSAFEFRAESFNTFNHPQWEADGANGGYGNSCGYSKIPNTTYYTCSAGNAGAITQAYDPRVFQLYAKISF
jgi:hypothetical protein